MVNGEHKMKSKRLHGIGFGVAFSILVVVLMISSATASPVLNKIDNNPEIEVNSQLITEDSELSSGVATLMIRCDSGDWHGAWPVSFARVTLSGNNVNRVGITGPFGWVSFHGLQTGYTYTATVIKRGFDTASLTKKFRAGENWHIQCYPNGNPVSRGQQQTPLNEKPAGIPNSLLIVQTYSIESVGKMNAPCVRVRCEGLESSYDRTKTTHGIFAWTIFFVEIGQRYKLTAPDYGNAEKLEIKISRFLTVEDLRVS